MDNLAWDSYSSILMNNEITIPTTLWSNNQYDNFSDSDSSKIELINSPFINQSWDQIQNEPAVDLERLSGMDQALAPPFDLNHRQGSDVFSSLHLSLADNFTTEILTSSAESEGSSQTGTRKQRRSPEQLEHSNAGFRISFESSPKLKRAKLAKGSSAGSSSINFRAETGAYEPDTGATAHVKEMIYRAAALTPVELVLGEVSEKPKRKNVRISSDPQTVAARHRRERISERLRILQRLVPGGAKMDTASMLDEAANYLKFLKYQVTALETLGASSPSPFEQAFPMQNPN